MRTPAGRLALMLVSLVVVLAAVGAVNWAINPYGAWRTTFINPAYRLTEGAADETTERVSTAYRIRVEQPRTLLVGSSRVLNGMPIDPGGHDGFFNASLSGASLQELAAVLRLGMANRRLRRVIWGVDFYAFDERFVGFRHPETRQRLEGDARQLAILRITETLLSMRALRDSSRVLLSAMSRRPRRPLPVSVPWPEHLIKDGLEKDGRGLARADDASIRAQLENWVVSYVDYRLARPQLDLFRKTVDEIRRAELELIVFVPPLSHCELEVIDQAGAWEIFQQWKRELLVAGPYWDFSGYGKLDRTPGFFIDVPHFKPAVGQVILRGFLGTDCRECGVGARAIRDAGVWVDATTVDAYLARQDAMRLASRGWPHSCAKVVEAMLRRHTAGS
jgi:hypothetical protein